MPNWCSTNIMICHDDNEKLKALYENIKKFIIPTLTQHLPFVEPSELEFDNRSLDY